MTSENVCRLCVTSCQDFQSLYDKNGQGNEAYQLMVKYFDLSVLWAEQGNQLSVMCSQCWQHISDFHKFQLSVLQAQQKLLPSHQNIFIKPEPGLQHAETIGNNANESHLDRTIKTEEEVGLDDSIDDEDAILPDKYCETRVDVSISDELMYEDDSMSELGESEEQFSTDEDASMSESDDETKASGKEEPTGSNTNKKQKEQERLKQSDETIARWKPYLACLMCSEACPTLTILQQHFRQEHPREECYVLCCRRRMKDRSKIEQHMRHHIDPNCYKCELCGERFRARSSLSVHRRSQHNGPKRKSNNRKSSKESDDIIAQWKPNLECVVCNETRPSYTLLQEHFSEEHPLDEVYISCCNRKLKARNRIEEHVRVHIDPDAFKCEICNKCFKMRWHLKNHMRRLHSNDKGPPRQKNPDMKNKYLSKMGTQYDELIAQWKPTLECVVCNESFPSFSLLEKHFRPTHPDDEFYITCCQLKLNRQYRVLDHARYHNDPNAFKCDVCGKLLRSKNALNTHISAQHRDKDNVREVKFVYN